MIPVIYYKMKNKRITTLDFLQCNIGNILPQIRIPYQEKDAHVQK